MIELSKSQDEIRAHREDLDNKNLTKVSNSIDYHFDHH